MPFGLQSINDGLVYQIDGESLNLVHSQTVSVTLNGGFMDSGRQNTGTQFQMTANVSQPTVTATAPLFVLYSPSVQASILKIVNTGANQWQVTIWSDTPTTVELHIYDRADVVTPGSGAFGAVIYNSSGQLIYNAAQKLVRVLGFASGNIGNLGPGFTTWNPPGNFTQDYALGVGKVGVAAIKTPFVCIGGASSANFGYSRIGGWQCIGGTARRGWTQRAIGGASIPAGEATFGGQVDWTAMFVDLTNL